MEFEPVIGLEVHAQLTTDTKIFCGCSTLFGGFPNTHTCPVCLGMPGMLPVLNKKVVEYTIRMGLATNCKIEHESRFARKNYFYPDLPKGYQISQYELPIAQFGHIDIEVGDSNKRIGITRIHMEEDAGKLSHDPDRPISFVDFNRTGVPLMEIVSEPDIRSPEEAGSYLRQLRSIVRYLGICDGNMEEGSFRCDANVSIRPIGAETFGTRTELKNLNSFKHVEKALHYEINRQKEVIFEGGKVVQETRLWDSVSNRTTSMRGKEEAHDYRYFPDPDLLPLVIDEDWIESVRETLPELPNEKKERFVTEYGLPLYDADVLTSNLATANYFEDCLKIFPESKTVSNWIMGSLMGLLNAEGKTIEQSPISSQDLANLLGLIKEGIISGKIAKVVFEEMAKTGKAPDKIVKEKGLVQVTDVSAIEEIILNVLADNAKEVADYRNGKTRLLGFFVGQVMKKTKGKANPKIVNEVLKEKLKNEYI
ncbi:MAG: Asp-tRNA(Asn)/Glu-tRNA(Gln) amidotransferase subunit GatB [Proteobacteria bacterium]|nr:Asp-tRNA(Asn)/Glu-tRNA(Gln) amidotransferase subunit GatB [Pseudomonadota bacterium]MBU4286716.1 Asp-tRNA(Asn)/Glu-tRNA(Gln) amidotransferase subunit GatB [Pseudomonadota bacterium]MBU4414810.1 Asp-tRNA(Asn)/Glu-tRNA(Gln) amidotransferase subunit GatB [Pseudomonadota bacterium]MCG2759448.1 Asp-tRNA(Asn)/Glu-tRNA(Gln) amidotransferase subunit GatB [Desulfobacteraceae bacterium]